MKINKKWFLQWGFSDGHPQRYHIMAVVLAMVALSIAITTKIFAQETTSGTTATVNTTTTACSYSYSDWGVCQSDGTRYRTVTGISPSGCVQVNAPSLKDSCSYSAPTTTTSGTSTSSATTAPQCGYSYSSWGSCQSNGKQGRTLLSKSPTGCGEYVSPVLEQSCTYVSATTQALSTTVSSVAVQCVYSYSSWGSCQTNGKRIRTLSTKSPTSCEEYVSPVLEQSCVYDNTVTPTPTTTATTTVATLPTTQTSGSSESAGNVTPTFAFVNVGEGMTVSGDFQIKGTVSGTQGVEYYLVPVGSNTYKYIGTGVRASDTEWRLDFHSKEFPNGEFYLRAKIKNVYGEYGGGQRKILVANSDQAGVSSGDFKPLVANDQEKIQTLQQFEQAVAIPKDTTVATGAETPDQLRKKIFDYCQENSQKCFPERDSDKDGLSDVDEIRYGTDPKSADTDLDGFIDGDEVKNGFDPLKYSPGDQSDKIVFENPKTTGEVKNDIYTVKNVELKQKGTGSKQLTLTGKGLPNSFVTIYVYSNDPIVLTVKTDSDGNWTYELDKELENGKHQVYVAITDNTGKITAKSEPLAFVKTAEAATVIPSAGASQSGETASVAQSRSQRDLFFLIAIVIGALAIALAAIGLIKHKRSSPTEEIVFRP